jgi:choline monooxygenase
MPSLPPLEIDEELARASTLPAAWYTDPEALARERRDVFARTWQWAAPLDRLARPGDFVATDVGGEPVLLVRGDDGVLRALSNVCRHRAGPVAAGCGNRSTLRCGYHGWSYGLDGALRATPEFEGAEDFDPQAVRLPAYACDTFGPFAFVRLSPHGPSLRESVPEVFAKTAARPLEALRLVVRREYEVACNWKTYVDNYLEGYHIPIVHPGLFREVDYNAYRVEPFALSSEQHAPVRRGDEAGRRYPNPEGAVPDVLYFWVFPNLMLNFYPDNLQLNLVLPLAPERTLTVFEWYFRTEPGAEPPTAESPGVRKAVGLADEVQREDMAICEAVQKGLASATYDRGRYCVKRENGVHHFHRRLARFLKE